MEPIRVLQIVTTMERAGLETMIMNYYRRMDREKVQFDFLRHRDGEHAYDREIREMGGRIFTVPAVNPLNTNGYLSALDAFFREHSEYRIVHAHLDCLSAIPLWYAKKYGIQTRISHSHVSKMTFDAKYPVRMFFKAFLPKTATELFACSEDAGKWMFGGNAFRIVPNAIDCGAFAYDAEKAARLRRENGLENAFVVGHVGRFDPVKNHAFLLDVFRRICARQPDSMLLLAGTGDTMPGIRSLAARYGVRDRVRFLGSVSNVADVLQMTDAFVFPSLYEGLGISLIEAQAAGLPCYASRGCVPEAANITKTVRYLPLEAGADSWAKQILEDGGRRERPDALRALRESGYEIGAAARRLQDFYMQRGEEGTR